MDPASDSNNLGSLQDGLSEKTGDSVRDLISSFDRMAQKTQMLNETVRSVNPEAKTKSESNAIVELLKDENNRLKDTAMAWAAEAKRAQDDRKGLEKVVEALESALRSLQLESQAKDIEIAKLKSCKERWENSIRKNKLETSIAQATPESLDPPKDAGDEAAKA